MTKASKKLLLDDQTQAVLTYYLHPIDYGGAGPFMLAWSAAQRHAPLVAFAYRGKANVRELCREDAIRATSRSYARRCLILGKWPDEDVGYGAEFGPLSQKPTLRAGLWRPDGLAEPTSYAPLTRPGRSAIWIPAARWNDWLNPEADVRELIP